MIKAEKKKTKPKIEINLQQVEKLAASGLTQQQIADSLGISVSTIECRLRENEEFKDAIKKGKAKGVAVIANQLFEKAKNGDTTSMIFFLKTQAGWKETQTIDLQSSDGTMSPKTAKDLTDAELEAELAKYGIKKPETSGATNRTKGKKS